MRLQAVEDMTFEEILASPIFQKRFWKKVAITGEDDCWLWRKSKDKDGYGQVAVGVGKGRIKRAHRIAFQLTHGYCPPLLDHKCWTRDCVNSKHLRPATASENQRNRPPEDFTAPTIPKRMYRRLQTTTARNFIDDGILYHEETRLYVIRKI